MAIRPWTLPSVIFGTALLALISALAQIQGLTTIAVAAPVSMATRIFCANSPVHATFTVYFAFGHSTKQDRQDNTSFAIFTALLCGYLSAFSITIF